MPPEAWIAGTAAVASSGAPSFFFEGDTGDNGGKGGKGRRGRAKKNASEGAVAAGPLPTAPADEAQRTCALTGEPFESYFDDSTGEWRYRDCMALDAAGAAAVGLPARRCLVKASALLMGDGGDDDDDDDGEGDDDDDDDEGDGSGGSEGEGDGKEAGGKRENGENDGDLDHQPSSVPLEQVEAALAEAAAAVGEAEGGADEEREDDEDPTTTRVKEEAAA